MNIIIFIVLVIAFVLLCAYVGYVADTWMEANTFEQMLVMNKEPIWKFSIV